MHPPDIDIDQYTHVWRIDEGETDDGEGDSYYERSNHDQLREVVNNADLDNRLRWLGIGGSDIVNYRDNGSSRSLIYMMRILNYDGRYFKDIGLSEDELVAGILSTSIDPDTGMAVQTINDLESRELDYGSQIELATELYKAGHPEMIEKLLGPVSEGSGFGISRYERYPDLIFLNSGRISIDQNPELGGKVEINIFHLYKTYVFLQRESRDSASRLFTGDDSEHYNKLLESTKTLLNLMKVDAKRNSRNGYIVNAGIYPNNQDLKKSIVTYSSNRLLTKEPPIDDLSPSQIVELAEIFKVVPFESYHDYHMWLFRNINLIKKRIKNGILPNPEHFEFISVLAQLSKEGGMGLLYPETLDEDLEVDTEFSFDTDVQESSVDRDFAREFRNIEKQPKNDRDQRLFIRSNKPAF